jgi:hypothetical protein
MSNQWGIVAAAWGDVLCSLSAVKQEGVRNLVYFGNMHGMDKFLSAQHFVDRVVSINYTDYGMEYADYHNIWHHLCSYNARTPQILSILFRMTKIPLDGNKVTNCCMDPFANNRGIMQASDISLPQEAVIWAMECTQDIKGYILICPYSYNSSPRSFHWSEWDSYLHWLLKSYPNQKFVYCNTDESGAQFECYPNFINMYRKTPTAAHMYALASLSQGVITTSNGLCHWLNASQIPSLVVLNKPAERPFDFYKRILDERWLWLLPSNSSLEFAKEITHQYISSSVQDRYLSSELLYQRDRHDMMKVLEKMPWLSQGFLSYHANLYEPHYEVIRIIFEIARPDSCFEVCCSDNGAGLVAALSGAPDMQSIGWTGPYLQTRQNIERFCDYFLNKSIPSLNNHAFFPTEFFHQQNNAIIIGGENDFTTRMEHLKAAIRSDASLVIFLDYFRHPHARAAAREVSQVEGLLPRLAHTDSGLLIWDKTRHQRIGRILDKQRITQLIR